MSLQPITCLICKSLSPIRLSRLKKVSPNAPYLNRPDLIVTDTPAEREGKEVSILTEHVAHCAAVEVKDKDDTEKRHAQAIEVARRAGMYFMSYQLAKCFDLPEDLKTPHERARAQFHADTRKVQMTDVDLRIFADGFYDGRDYSFDALRDLRDRYEELGKYAPAPSPAQSTTGSPAQDLTQHPTGQADQS